MMWRTDVIVDAIVRVQERIDATCSTLAMAFLHLLVVHTSQVMVVALNFEVRTRLRRNQGPFGNRASRGSRGYYDWPPMAEEARGCSGPRVCRGERRYAVLLCR